METQTFKKIVGDFLKEKKFKKDGNNFLKLTEEVICSVELQRSNFSNTYYINVGVVLRSLRPELLKPKSYKGDIRFRFSSFGLSSSPENFDLNIIDEKQGNDLILCLNRNFEEGVNDCFSISGLKESIERRPYLSYQASINARSFFNLI